MSVTLAILVITIIVSYRAMEDSDLKYKMMFNPVKSADNGEWYRVLSHALIHADWMHLIFNMYVLYMFIIWYRLTIEHHPICHIRQTVLLILPNHLHP